MHDKNNQSTSPFIHYSSIIIVHPLIYDNVYFHLTLLPFHQDILQKERVLLHADSQNCGISIACFINNTSIYTGIGDIEFQHVKHFRNGGRSRTAYSGSWNLVKIQQNAQFIYFLLSFFFLYFSKYPGGMPPDPPILGCAPLVLAFSDL